MDGRADEWCSWRAVQLAWPQAHTAMSSASVTAEPSAALRQYSLQ